MRVITALVLLLLAAPLAHAAEVAPPAVTPSVQSSALAAPVAPSMALEQVQVRQIQESTAVAAAGQEMPRRNSFWWMVGVIVVAGIILAVVLD